MPEKHNKRFFLTTDPQKYSSGKGQSGCDYATYEKDNTTGSTLKPFVRHLNQTIKLSVSSNGTDLHHVPPDMLY